MCVCVCVYVECVSVLLPICVGVRECIISTHRPTGPGLASGSVSEKSSSAGPGP